jgi:hypothetical protein
MSAKNTTLALILTLLFLAAGCTSGSYVTVKSFENNTADSMSMRYEKFSGTKSKTISLDEPATVCVNIVSDTGSLGLTITDKDGRSYYEGNELPSSSFSVSLDTPGKYKITIKADNHKGSYDISWDHPDS